MAIPKPWRYDAPVLDRAPIAALASALLVTSACEPKGGSATPEAAAKAAEAWVATGVKGDVRTTSMSCQGDGGRFRCEGAVEGGGNLLISGTFSADSWAFELAEPVIVASRLEDLIRTQHAELGVTIVPSCGDRVRPSKKGETFKCLLRDADGKEVSAAEVTVTDAKTSNVEVKRLTELVDRQAVEAELQKWLGDDDVTGKVRCPPPRRHFSLPDTSFLCDVEGVDRKVKVTVVDYRAKATWDWAAE